MNAVVLSPDISVHAAFRARPRLAENLAAFGAEPWDRPGAPLRELFRNSDTLGRFLAMAASLPVPSPGSRWSDLPLSHLADRLTQDHREFRGGALSAIAAAFEEWDSLDPEITELRDDFARAAAAVAAEMENEETLFFPRALRYEASLRDPRVNPEFNGGSLRVAVAYRRSRAPGLAADRFVRIAGRLRDTHAFRDGDPRAGQLAGRIEDFGARFAEHERLETEVLFPLAVEMETTLYNLSIAGARTEAVAI